MGAFFAIFLSVFLAELGDKTQIATLLFASNVKLSPFMVFIASAGALVLSSAIAVLAGCAAKSCMSHIPIKLISGLLFVLMGVWMIYGYYK